MIMNIDLMLQNLVEFDVEFLVLGGVNFMLRHEPILTFDLDVWVRPVPENLRKCECTLKAMNAEWGETEHKWGSVSRRNPGWLGAQAVYCMICDFGALDIFLMVKGLSDWECAWADAVELKTAGGVVCRGLSDLDMLRCQQALPENERKNDRIRMLEKALNNAG